jgi:hypothetical protein
MDIKEVADNLVFDNGIWYSKNSSEISYPKEGNKDCFEVEKDSFWFKHRNNCILEAVKKYSKNEVFFDIGGGNGYVAKGLEDNGIESILVEPGVDGALNAKAIGLKNIICSTFQDAGVKANSCKAIGLFDVVEHIEDDGKFLNSINAILAEKGLVYITVPAFNTLWSLEDVYAGHYRRYTLGKMKKVLEKEGFSVVYSTYIFSILPIPVFLFRTLPYWLRLSKKSKGLKDYKKEHSQNKGMVSSILESVWKLELSQIKKYERIPIGGSCFVVAKKMNC